MKEEIKRVEQPVPGKPAVPDSTKVVLNPVIDAKYGKKGSDYIPGNRTAPRKVTPVPAMAEPGDPGYIDEEETIA